MKHKLSRDKRLKRIMRYYGNEHQLEKTKEELLELIVAIDWRLQCMADNKAGKQFTPLCEAHRSVQDEMADVYIMLEQVKQLFKCDLIDERIDFKLDRQIKRIEKEEEEQR